MSSLSRQRCFNHALREAAARCPECGHNYCRECITDHDDRVICAACLRKLTASTAPARSRFTGYMSFFQVLAGLFLVWLFFYWLGEGLLSISTSSHESKVWKIPWSEP